jgi:hypothetical protein
MRLGERLGRRRRILARQSLQQNIVGIDLGLRRKNACRVVSFINKR